MEEDTARIAMYQLKTSYFVTTGRFLTRFHAQGMKKVSEERNPSSSRGTTLLYSSIKNKIFKWTNYLILNKILHELNMPSAVYIHKAEINKIH